MNKTTIFLIGIIAMIITGIITISSTYKGFRYHNSEYVGKSFMSCMILFIEFLAINAFLLIS